MTSSGFFAAVREEWGLIVDQTAGTRLADELDGSRLAAVRPAEQSSA